MFSSLNWNVYTVLGGLKRRVSFCVLLLNLVAFRYCFLSIVSHPLRIICISFPHSLYRLIYYILYLPFISIVHTVFQSMHCLWLVYLCLGLAFKFSLAKKLLRRVKRRNIFSFSKKLCYIFCDIWFHKRLKSMGYYISLRVELTKAPWSYCF